MSIGLSARCFPQAHSKATQISNRIVGSQAWLLTLEDRDPRIGAR
jgi:hypothetical protein